MGITFASFRISQVRIHIWCHIWELHVRPSVYHKFQFIHGAMYGIYMCVLPYFTSSTSCMVPYMAMRFASFRISQVSIHAWCHMVVTWASSRISQVPHHLWYHRWHHVWYHIKVLQPYMAPSIPYMIPYSPYMHAIYDFFTRVSIFYPDARQL